MKKEGAAHEPPLASLYTVRPGCAGGHPRLHHATAEQRQQWELIGQGRGIHWEAIDEDISVAGLLGLPND
ncbi:MAG TPA: DUF2442 domain-containing protein [Ktedonobacteraceae bacterium]|nr:DUF2442 domain-containing protein [Ktedonobacteraceae bacterium]